MPDAPTTPWTEPMPSEQFERMRQIIGAPSPIGFEAAMTRGVIEPMLQPHLPESWGVHRFRGNAGIVFDSHPGRDDLVSLLICGHADKIRLQVRRIGDEEAATSRQIPVQRRVVGRDTGNDAMAAVLASVDSAAAAVGFPIRNMHTISESAHEGDVLAAIHGLLGLIEDLDQRHDGAGVRRDELSELHPRLDLG